jgi:hypothetical protein
LGVASRYCIFSHAGFDHFAGLNGVIMCRFGRNDAAVIGIVSLLPNPWRNSDGAPQCALHHCPVNVHECLPSCNIPCAALTGPDL